jgi:hypothetical protein
LLHKNEISEIKMENIQDPISQPSGQHSCFVLGISQVKISVQRPAMLTEDFCSFSQSLQVKDNNIN